MSRRFDLAFFNYSLSAPISQSDASRCEREWYHVSAQNYNFRDAYNYCRRVSGIPFCFFQAPSPNAPLATMISIGYFLKCLTRMIKLPYIGIHCKL